ncbi:MAG TPA: YtxH domain-containing protein [Panacibacter sp.]|nr:YtxH domain-containing protein [Panacibacter sp.]
MKLQSFVNGMLVGIVLGILYAPDSGAASRRKLRRRTEELKDSLMDAYLIVSGDISEKIEKVEQLSENWTNTSIR